MSNITNNYAEGSCVFNAGSSQNGDVTINGDIHQSGAPQDSGRGASPSANAADGRIIGSPIFLTDRRGVRIDLIRVMNAWYECGNVRDGNGGKMTKKEFFAWVGKLFNIDLADYDKDLSNSMSSSVAAEKQTRIFDEMKAKHMEIYNGK